MARKNLLKNSQFARWTVADPEGVTIPGGNSPGSGVDVADNWDFENQNGDAPLSGNSEVIAAVVDDPGFQYEPGDTITLAGGTATTPAVLAVTTVQAVAVNTISDRGSDYAPGDTITLDGGTFDTATVLTVLTVRAKAAVADNAGAGYAPGDTITLTGGTFTTAAVLTVNSVQVSGVAIAGGGTGYTVDDILTVVGGTGTAATLKVTSVNSGVIDGIIVESQGNYTARPSNPVAVTGGTGTGATFNLTWEIFDVTVTTPGSYTVVPGSPVAQGSTSGSGTGATFNLTWELGTVSITTPGDYSELPPIPTAQASTSGVGIDAEFSNIDYGVLTVTIDEPGEYSVIPDDPVLQEESSGGGAGAEFNVSWSSDPTQPEVEVTREATTHQDPIPGAEYPPFFIRISYAEGANELGVDSYAVLRQRLGVERRCTSRHGTFSFFARASAPCEIGIRVKRAHGNTGDPPVIVASSQVQIGTEWIRLNLPLVFGDLSEKTISEDGGDYLQVEIYTQAGTDTELGSGGALGWGQVIGGYVDIAAAQLEVDGFTPYHDDEEVAAALADELGWAS